MASYLADKSEVLPTRAKWEYDPTGESEALAEMTERAVKAELAFRNLKRRLAVNVHLSPDQLKRIAAAKSSTEIAEIVAEAEQDEAARAAQTESSATEGEKEPKYISADGFLKET